MDFAFTAEQELLRNSLAAFLQDRYEFSARRKAAAVAPHWRPEIWQSFGSELEILAVAAPEETVGFGDGAIENMIVMEELGKVLALEPWNEAVVMATSILSGGGEVCADLLHAIVKGDAIVIPAVEDGMAGYGRTACGLTVEENDSGEFALSGVKNFVRSASSATHFVVLAHTAAGEPGLYVLAADVPGLTVENHALVCGKSMADLYFKDVVLPACARIASAATAADRVALSLDRGIAALCAESLGIQRRLLAQTVDYAKQRKQFGRSIAEFQALQHRMADMYIKVEEAASMTFMANLMLNLPAAERAKAVSAAKVAVDKAGRVVGESAVQIHGGMGITRELPAADMFARLTAIAQELGSTDFHLKRFEACSDAE